MNFLSLNFTTLEEGKKELQEGVSLRNKMSGSLYYNAVNYDCCKIADKLIRLGGDKIEISNILGKGTHIPPL